MNYREAYEKLRQAEQTHLLAHYEELTKAQRQALLAQIEATDFSVVLSVVHNGGKKSAREQQRVITPLTAMQTEEIAQNRERFTQLGLEAIRAGRVGAVMLAGGMGTRLGSEEPKGMYNIGLTRSLYIFECQIQNLLQVAEQAGAWPYLFIMTSDKNHETTVSFFEQHHYFGYRREYIRFFRQEMAPATDYQGRVYLEEKGKISTSPNGNGGWFASMKTAGLLELVKKEGIEWLNVFAVDNVLQRIADPCFVGAVMDKNCACGAKVVRKNAPDERVGVMCLKDGRPSIVEYYELTDEMMHAVTADGEPAYHFGVILNYLFREKDLEATLGREMPLHIVEKKIDFLDEAGNTRQPDAPNGYKYETLVLDMIESMESCLPYEVVRQREFAPVKNREGVDSVDTARVLLQKNGVTL